MDFLMAIDQGSTSTRVMIYNEQAKEVCSVQQKTTQIFPEPGWVELDAIEIWETTNFLLDQCIKKSKINLKDIKALGITNQRETVVVWERATGKAIYSAIMWQCRRTSNRCQAIIADGMEEIISEKTGLVVDAYFSATKIEWILDKFDPMRSRSKSGELMFGTIDSWLLWKLTKGQSHATDYTNASRTMLFNIHTCCWDKELLDYFNIPEIMLPQVKPSSHYFGNWQLDSGEIIPIAAMVGDQQASLFGQGCFKAGEIKNTYGTGCFLLMHSGDKPIKSANGLITTMAANLDDKPLYALEGSVFVAGAVINWLIDGLGMISDIGEISDVAQQVEDNMGVYFVPAFVGLGAPYWDSQVRGQISGLTGGVDKRHMIRAALEAIAYQTKDVVDLMASESGIEIRSIQVDGGVSKNEFLMQFQADMLNGVINCSEFTESTALGAVFLAGLKVGIWQNKDDIKALVFTERTYYSQMNTQTREVLYKGWKQAVKQLIGN